MPRRVSGMSALQVANAKPGRHALGNCLYLLVKPNNTRFWLLRWVRNGRMREMGLGRAPGRSQDHAAVTLKEATERAGRLVKFIRDGGDPIAERRAAAAETKAEAQEAAIKAITFRSSVDHYLEAHSAKWANEKHAKQWRATLVAYVFPVLGDLPVADVGTEQVLKALQPIWTTKAETASRVRGRIEAVLSYAASRTWRTSDNPARWKGHLSNLLPARGDVAPVEHHAALPWKDIASFVAAVRQQPGFSAKALEFVILTAARSGEVLGATWREIDMAEKLWTIPPGRMKSAREHRVPLSSPALALLEEMAQLRDANDLGAYLFPGAIAKRPLSGMAPTMVLRRMKRGDLTVHGFRSTFRDWVSERTDYPREVAEAALAHAVGDKVEAAYRRGDLFEKRRVLMEEWAAYCCGSA